MPAPLILSVYHGYHDSAVTVATPDRVLVHLLAERHFGHKNLRLDAAGMDELVAAALQYVGADIAACGRLLLASWGSPHPTDATAVTVGGRALSVTRTRHHRNHAYSSTVRPTDGSLVLCFDGGSEDGYATLYDVHNGTLANLDVLDDTLLTGKFYGTATQVVLQPQFIRAHAADTGKLLGLSAFGSYSTEIEKLVLANLAEVNALHFDDPGDLRTRMGLSDDYHQPWRDQRRADFAHTVQRMWEHELLDTLAPHAGDRPILLVGGCAHNVLANSVLSRSGLFPEVRVPPAPGDGGRPGDRRPAGRTGRRAVPERKRDRPPGIGQPQHPRVGQRRGQPSPGQHRGEGTRTLPAAGAGRAGRVAAAARRVDRRPPVPRLRPPGHLARRRGHARGHPRRRHHPHPVGHRTPEPGALPRAAPAPRRRRRTGADQHLAQRGRQADRRHAGRRDGVLRNHRAGRALPRQPPPRQERGGPCPVTPRRA